MESHGTRRGASASALSRTLDESSSNVRFAFEMGDTVALGPSQSEAILSKNLRLLLNEYKQEQMTRYTSPSTCVTGSITVGWKTTRITTKRTSTYE